MRKISKTMLIVMLCASIPSFADQVSVNGKTYQFSNSCSINTGPPMTIQDCCGATVAVLQREAIIIDGGP